MADPRRATVVVWGEAPPVAQMPVRCLEAELAGDVVVPKSLTLCINCGCALAPRAGKPLFCQAKACLEAKQRRNTERRRGADLGKRQP